MYILTLFSLLNNTIHTKRRSKLHIACGILLVQRISWHEIEKEFSIYVVARLYRIRHILRSMSQVKLKNFVEFRDFLLGLLRLLSRANHCDYYFHFVKFRRDNYRFQWTCYCWALLHDLMACLWESINKFQMSFFSELQIGRHTSISASFMYGTKIATAAVDRWYTTIDWTWLFLIHN